MTFINHYAETMYPLFLNQIQQDRTSHSWACDIQVTKKWMYTVRYDTNRRTHSLTFMHTTKPFGYIKLVDGFVTESQHASVFKYLFLALSSSVIQELYHDKTFKISKIKLEERFLPASPYRWKKIEYYLQMKDDQRHLYEMFGDDRYQRRMKWLDRGISSYMKQIKTTLV